MPGCMGEDLSIVRSKAPALKCVLAACFFHGDGMGQLNLRCIT